jgi:hypothetical protein
MSFESSSINHFSDGAINTAADAQSRPVWMSNEGRHIYDNWANALLDVCDTAEFYDNHIQSVQNYAGRAAPHRDYMTNLDTAFRSYFQEGFMGPIHKVDAAHGISETHLKPYLNEITHMTSVTEFAERKHLEPLPAAMLHAHDSLRFATILPAALANDTFYEKYCPGKVFVSTPEQVKQDKLKFQPSRLS